MASSFLQASLLPCTSSPSAPSKAPSQASFVSLPLPSARQNLLCAHQFNKAEPRREVAAAAQETPVAPAAVLDSTTNTSSSSSSSHVDGSLVVPAPAPAPAAAAEASSGSDIQEPSAFISDVASLIKLVDSRDIVELDMKHANYEILIRKREAVEAATATAQAQASSSSGGAGYQTFPGPHVMAHTAFPWGAPPSAPPPAPAPAAPPAPPPVAAPPPPAPSANAGLPPMLSPMAGTLYRAPAPGEPSFVKVGDRISKGQVVCIIEAMKLMNEIEADQSGTVVEFLAEDGKPVSIESPLLVIKP